MNRAVCMSELLQIIGSLVCGVDPPKVCVWQARDPEELMAMFWCQSEGLKTS